MSFGTRRTGHVANLLVRFALANDKVVPAGWAPRTLIQCGVAYPEIWDILHGMYESQVTFIPPSPPPPPLALHIVSVFSTIPRVAFPFTCEIVDTLASYRFSYVFAISHPSLYPPYIFPSHHPHVLFQTRQIPPFNQQQNVQAISGDIAVLLDDWLEEAKRSRQSHSYGSGLGSSVSGVGAGVREDEFPVFRIDQAIDQYLAELEPTKAETKAKYEGVKRQLRRSF